MFPWNLVWAPQVHFPLSGNVEQDIEPITSLLFGAIPPKAGNGRIEQQAFKEASYGKQLGLITDLLLSLASQLKPTDEAGKDALERLEVIRDRIEHIKTVEYSRLVDAMAEQAHQLKEHRPDDFARLLAKLPQP